VNGRWAKATRSIRKALDPLVLHAAEAAVRRRGGDGPLSFGESLDGSRDILIVAAKHLTDLLAVVPAAQALKKRYPLARIHVLADPVSADALSGRPEIFEAVPWDDEPILSRTMLERMRKLRARGFDLAIAIDDGSAHRDRVLAALTGAKLRLGLHRDGADPTLNLVVACAPGTGYRPVQSLEFLSFLGIPRERLTPCWEIPDADRRYAERLLDLRRRGASGWLLAVDPAPGRTGVRPHPAKLAWLVERVVASRGALPIILTDRRTGGYIEDFKSHLKVPTLDAPTRGMRDVLAFLGGSGLFLSGNTNLFHFAVALSVPTIGFFGRDELEQWVPRDRPSCRVARIAPGERVRETEFLEIVDQVRESDGRKVPTGVSAPPSETATEPAARPGRVRTDAAAHEVPAETRFRHD
jgi:heptosyltransferase-2